MYKIDYKFSTVCEKNEKMSGPLGGDFFWLTLYIDLYHRRRPATEKKAEDELPSEYLASSLSKQPQGPPQRSEQEIQEEEELQLALALSQSEHEAKDKEVDEPFHFLLELSNYHVNALRN